MKQEEPFSQLHLRFTDPIQYDYAVIRPIVLFAQSANNCSQETQVSRTTIREKARQFVIEGMLGLVDQRAKAACDREVCYPDPIAKYILYLKYLYPAIHYREIGRILRKKFSNKTNHGKVQRFWNAILCRCN